MQTETAKIGEGIYTATDAAQIFKIPYGKAKYWFNQYAGNKFLKSVNFRYYFEIKDIKAINFLSLIEMYVFYELRNNGVKVNEIIRVHKHLSEVLETPYPFAKEKIYSYGKYICYGDDNNKISASLPFQRVIDNLKPFFKKISYSGDNKLAKKFYPLGKTKTIVVNPENQFGQPIIENTNILAYTIYDYYMAGESIDFISCLYDISKENVKDAIEFLKVA